MNAVRSNAVRHFSCGRRGEGVLRVSRSSANSCGGGRVVEARRGEWPRQTLAQREAWLATQRESPGKNILSCESVVEIRGSGGSTL